jgi:hypothetical protein
MTKKQLIKKLEKISDDTVIIMASDGEGNSFDSLRDIFAEKGLKWDGENKEILDEDDNKEIYDNYDNLPNCVILWP